MQVSLGCELRFKVLSMDRFLELRAEMDIQISDLQSCLCVDHDRLRGWVKTALRDRGVLRATLSIVLVDDPAIRLINARHLGHDYATDVITFPLSEPDDPELAGEIVISTQTATTMAESLAVSPQHELALYAVHGVLHLCGFDDQDVDSRQEMETQQTRIMAMLEADPGTGDLSAALFQWNAGGSKCPQ